MNIEKKRLDVAEPLVADVLRDKSLDGLKARVGALKLRASIAMERGHPEAAIPDLREVLGREFKSPDLCCCWQLRTSVMDQLILPNANILQP